jgi:hypothetical protein
VAAPANLRICTPTIANLRICTPTVLCGACASQTNLLAPCVSGERYTQQARKTNAFALTSMPFALTVHKMLNLKYLKLFLTASSESEITIRKKKRICVS